MSFDKLLTTFNNWVFHSIMQLMTHGIIVELARKFKQPRGMNIYELELWTQIIIS